MQEVEGSTFTGGTCPNDFSDPIDQDIRTQRALSWKIVVSEWRSVIAVSLNVGGGVRLIKPAKLCKSTQNTTNTTRTDARHRVCAAMVPYRWATRGTSLGELEYTRTSTNQNWSIPANIDGSCNTLNRCVYWEGQYDTHIVTERYCTIHSSVIWNSAFNRPYITWSSQVRSVVIAMSLTLFKGLHKKFAWLVN